MSTFVNTDRWWCCPRIVARALLIILTAGVYLHRMYNIKESGVMVEEKVNFYIGTELIFLVLALPSLFSKGKPKAA